MIVFGIARCVRVANNQHSYIVDPSNAFNSTRVIVFQYYDNVIQSMETVAVGCHD